MTATYPAVSDANSIILDANVIVNFSKLAPGGLALDYLVIDNTTSYVTQTVEDEVLNKLNGLQRASYLQWAYRNHTIGEVNLINTGTPS